MARLIRKAFSSVGSTLLALHIVGSAASFFVFSYQYAREHGFLSWLLFGEFVPGLKAAVWEVFLILTLVQGAEQQHVLTSEAQDFWWQPEYMSLVQFVSSDDDSTVSITYQSGLKASDQTTCSVLIQNDSSLVLRVELPKKALFTLDPETGQKVPSKTTPIYTIRDHDLNGTPDDFRIEPEGEPISREQLTEDGYTVYRSSPEQESVPLFWGLGIGFCINHFLHGVDSPMPRQEDSQDWPELTAEELSEMSLVSGKAMREPLEDEDLKRFTKVVADYSRRVARPLSKQDLWIFAMLLETTYQYDYELGRCLLHSIDGGEPFVSNDLERLRQLMETQGFARKAKLDADYRKIVSAARGKIFTDEFGNQYHPTTRQDVLDGFEQIEMVKGNLDKISAALEDWTSREAK